MLPIDSVTRHIRRHMRLIHSRQNEGQVRWSAGGGGSGISSSVDVDIIYGKLTHTKMVYSR